MCRHRRVVRAAQNEIGNFMTALEARRGQFICAIIERDVARAKLQGVHAKRDDVIRLAETREAARIRTMFQATRQATEFDRREQELIC